MSSMVCDVSCLLIVWVVIVSSILTGSISVAGGASPPYIRHGSELGDGISGGVVVLGKYGAVNADGPKNTAFDYGRVTC